MEYCLRNSINYYRANPKAVLFYIPLSDVAVASATQELEHWIVLRNGKAWKKLHLGIPHITSFMCLILRYGMDSISIACVKKKKLNV